MNNSLPKYIERGGEQVYAAPFAAKGVELFSFPVKGDIGSIQNNICDRYLNEPLEVSDRFVPLTDYVMFVFNTIESLVSVLPPFNTMGSFPEKEGAVWTALVDREREQLFWFHPYMVVDLSYAMAMGREIYGFPKTIGWFDIPQGPQAPESLSVETIVVDKFSLSSKGQRAKLIGVNRNDAIKSQEPSSFKTIRELADELVRLLNIEHGLINEIKLGVHLLEDLVELKMPMGFLKQFRDGVDPTRACYQAIQEVNSRMTRFEEARLYHEDYEVDFENFESHPIRADLGLSSGPLSVEAPFWVRFDFEIDDCTIVGAS